MQPVVAAILIGLITSLVYDGLKGGTNFLLNVCTSSNHFREWLKDMHSNNPNLVHFVGPDLVFIYFEQKKSPPLAWIRFSLSEDCDNIEFCKIDIDGKGVRSTMHVNDVKEIVKESVWKI